MPAHRAEGFRDLLNDLRLTRLRNGARRWEMEQGGDDPAATGHLTFAELVTFTSWQDYARSYSRTTKWDVMLEGLAREYHTGSEPPQLVAAELQRGFPAGPRAEGSTAATAPPAGSAVAPLAGGAAQKGKRTSDWLLDRIAWSLDRCINEMFITYDRFTAMRQRERGRKLR